MRLLTITNLYPRPDQPTRGLFNARLFRAMAGAGGDGTAASSGRARSAGAAPRNDLVNVCLVPEWRVGRWRDIRRWKDPFTEALNTRYVPVFYVPIVGRNLSGWTYGQAMAHLAAEAAACDAVLATWLYPDGVAASDLARQAGRPCWLKVHGTDRFHLRHRFRGARVRRSCAQAAGLLSNCRFLADALVEAGIDAGRIHVVRNGVETGVFRYRPRAEARAWLREHGGVPPPPYDHERLVLFVGNLLPVKGPDLLLGAWALLTEGEGAHLDLRSRVGKEQRAGGGMRLVVIGDGPMRPELESWIRKRGIETSVVFLGSRRPDEVARWMNAADCLCLPSRSEGMPNVVMEAMACGLPVAAHGVGEVPHLVRDGVYGWVLRAEDMGTVSERTDGGDLPRLDRPRCERRLAELLRRCLDGAWDRAAMAAAAPVITWEEAAARTVRLMEDSLRPPGEAGSCRGS